MKVWKNRLILILTPLILGLNAGEFLELEGHFNARYSANFVKSAKNIKTVLPPGTQGRIEETKKFSSGNYGLKVEITKGSHKGEKVWLYYNVNKPQIKLYQNESALEKGQATSDVEQARAAVTREKVPALRIPAQAEENEKRTAAKDIVEKIQSSNAALKEHGRPGGPCSDCEVSNSYARDSYIPKRSADAATIKPPTRTVNPFGIRSTRCRTMPGPYESCTYEGDSEPGFFKLSNNGPNRIVAKGESRSREWGFHFEGNARQDLGFSVTDAPNGTISQLQESYFMLFPRVSLPTIRLVGNRQVVTLPTGETVTFNAQTKEIIGGVLSEDGAMTSGGAKLDPAKISYRGSGVAVRVDSRGSEPRLNRNGTATITKQGRVCKVPIKDLWPNQSENSPVHFKFATDEPFNAYLKKKCGFGL